MSSGFKHRQVSIATPPEWAEFGFPERVEVDEGMVDLLTALWRLRYVTLSSCQENDSGEVFICFLAKEQADRFAALVGGARRWVYESSWALEYRGHHFAYWSMAFAAERLPAITSAFTAYTEGRA
jgi:hypothetical protein